MKRQKAYQWSRLDNAAKIFPPSSTVRDPKVFRFACELTEPVDPELLQQALDETLEQFPFYQSVLKKGLFWYYLESTDQRPLVSPEHEVPCAMLYKGEGRDLLFRVTWYKCRINLEVFHALSDGTGALHFLRMMVYHYLLRAHADEFADGIPPINYDASGPQKVDDSFSRYFGSGAKGRLEQGPRAFHLHGDRLPDGALSILEGELQLNPLLARAKEQGTTLTVFLAAVLMQAIQKQMSQHELRRPVVVSVPVNLRNYFPSATARNFFTVLNVSYDFSQGDGSLQDIIRKIDADLKANLTKEALALRLNRLAALEHTMLLRVMPLIFKIPVLKASHWAAARQVTAAFSNIGRVDMPEPMHRYIRLFDAFLSTQRMQAVMTSFDGRFLITFTAPFVSPEVQRSFFRILTGMGLEVTITSNYLDVEGMD